MLIVCNGAYKSGSTWIYDIISEILEYTPIPAEYRNKAWNNPNILEEVLPTFIENVDFHSKHYIFKSHYKGVTTKELLRNKTNIFIFNIVRDLRDVVVSAYYHEQRHKSYQGSFEDFYFEIGIKRIKGVDNYHKFWNNDLDNICVLNYALLKTDFENQIKGIAKFLDLDIEDKRLLTIMNNNEFNNRKRNNPENAHLRKGEIGDYINHFTQKVTDHYNLNFGKN